MIKKYFKYTLFSLIAFIGFTMNAMAFDCQYEIPLGSGSGKDLYAYVRLVNSGSYSVEYDTSGKYYVCISEKQNSSYVCNTAYTGWLDSITINENGRKDKFSMVGIQDIVNKTFENNKCNGVKYSVKENKKNLSPSTGAQRVTGYDINFASSDSNYTNTASPMKGSGTTGEVQESYFHRAEGKGENIEMTAIVDPNGAKRIKMHVSDGTNSDNMTCPATYGANFECKSSKLGITYIIYSEELPNFFTDKQATKTSNDYKVTVDGDKRYISRQEDASNKVTVTGEDGIKNDTQYISLSSMCSNDKVKRVVRFFGYLLNVTKILIPIGLIIFGAIAFTQAMLSGDDEKLKKVAVGFIWKLIAAVIIFVIPTVVSLIIKAVDEDSKASDAYSDCSSCIFNPKSCK